MSTLTHHQHQDAAANLRARAANRHRNADELWHLFSRTHDPLWKNQITTEAQREDRASEHLHEAANYHDDQAATIEAEADERARANPPPFLQPRNFTPRTEEPYMGHDGSKATPPRNPNGW